MTIIKRPTGKVKSREAKNPLSFCYTNHKEPSPLDRFLGIAYRKHGHGLWKSTHTIGVTLFHTLKNGPQVLNIAQLARDTGYSRPVVYRALAYYSKFGDGKIQRINERRTGKRRPCEYKLHSSFTEKQEGAKPQEKVRCRVSVNSHSIESKDIQTTKDRTQLLMESFNQIPREHPLTERQKRTGAFLIRFERKKALVSGLVDSLWRRNCIAAIWQDVLTGLDDLPDIVTTDTELLWRSRKAIKSLVQGGTIQMFRSIMLDQPANEQEAVERDLAEIDRRLVGLDKWGVKHGCTSWLVEKRAQLEKEKYNVQPPAITVDGFFTTVEEPQPERQRPRGGLFHVSEHYTGKRQPLEGENLERKKVAASAWLQGRE